MDGAAPLIQSQHRRIALVVNPAKSRAARVVRELRARAGAMGLPDPLIYETTVDDPGAVQACAAIGEDVDTVIAVGGDGTVRTVAGALAGSGVALGIVPIGTANLLARNLGGFAANPGDRITAALTGELRRIDLGRIHYRAEDGSDADDVFLVVAGFGLDATAIAHTDERAKARLGWVAYFSSITREMWGPPLAVSLAFDDEEAEETTLRSLLVGNCGLLPAGISLIPQADLADGQLDVLIMQPRSAAGWLPVAWSVLSRSRRASPHIRERLARRLTVTSDTGIDVHVDGDAIGRIRQAEIRVDPGAVLVRTIPRPS